MLAASPQIRKYKETKKSFLSRVSASELKRKKHNENKKRTKSAKGKGIALYNTKLLDCTYSTPYVSADIDTISYNYPGPS